MHDVLAFLKDVDLGGHTLHVLDLIQRADLCFVGLVVSVLICLGYKMSSGNPVVFGWGIRLALLTFLVYGGVSWFYATEIDSQGLAVLAARSGLFGGAVLASIWIFFPILVFVYGHLRLALTGFLLYGGYALIVTGRDFQVEQLPGIGLRSAVAAGLAVIVAWIFQPVWELIARRFPKPRVEEPKVAAPVLAGAAPAPASGDAEALARLERKQRKLKKKLRRQAQQGNNDDDDILGDDDEVRTVQIEMRRRRDKARLTVELTYAMSMSEMNSQLPRDMFENWINRYLGDHLPPEDVEENSKHLQEMMTQQKKIAQQMANSNSGTQLEDLNHWFLDEQRRIQNDMSIDLGEKQRKLLDLQQMYTSLVNRVLGDQSRAVVPLPYRPTGTQGEINAM